MAGANAARSFPLSAAICWTTVARAVRACATAWARPVESRVNVCWSAGVSLRPRALRDCDEAFMRASVVESASKPRASMDSIDRGFEADSTTRARMNASSEARKARGRRLTPADQQTFTRDSTGRAQAVAQARTARATVVQQMAVDSGKLRAAFAPAIEALRDYLTAYPGEADAATSLATLYAQSGHA